MLVNHFGRIALTLQRDAMRLRKLIVDQGGWSGQIYFQHRVGEYRAMWQRVAAAQGATFTELEPDLWQIDLGQRRIRILNHELEFDNPVTLGLAGRKPAVHQLLHAAGLAVPEHASFTLDRLEDARRFVAQHPRGCVIKPAAGYGGKGVTTHVHREGEVRRAALLASLYGSTLLVEAMIPGESYRLLVLEGKVIHAVCRRGMRLQGDGASTVRQLLQAANKPRRAARLPPVRVDRDCLFTLAAQDMTLDSRPEAGQTLLAKSIPGRTRKYAELRTVYTHPASDLISESIRRDAEEAARIIGSDFLGVDVITLDPSVPLAQSGGVINEVNTTPALHHHYDPSQQARPEVALKVMEALLARQPATTGRI